jgi:hypothetical protein
MFCWPCIIVYQYSRTNKMHFLYSIYYELTASTRFEHYLLTFRRFCINNSYIACVLCRLANTNNPGSSHQPACTVSLLTVGSLKLQGPSGLVQGLLDISKSSSGQGRIKLFGAPSQWKFSAPYFKQCFFRGEGGGITPPPQAESNTTPPSPKTEITKILFYILNFASVIKFKM